MRPLCMAHAQVVWLYIKKPPTMMHGRGCVVWCGGGVVYALIIFRPVKRFC